MRSKFGTPSPPQHTASPSMMQERERGGDRFSAFAGTSVYTP
jgi:hypothetical protein